MLNRFFTTLCLLFMILTLTPACAEQDNSADATVSKKQTQETTASAAQSAPEANVTDNANSIMNTPVNFSTPEDVEKSIDMVRQEAGEAQARQLNNAMGYILAYDIGLGRDKQKMYKKLNGRTPNEIIAKMKR
ncbi:MAG: hypothetical protein WBS20_01040 [Lysobacterales bacterium]